jgi:hypothetical protein
LKRNYWNPDQGLGTVQPVSEGGVRYNDPGRPADSGSDNTRSGVLEAFGREFVKIVHPGSGDELMIERLWMWVHRDEITGFQRTETAAGQTASWALKLRGLAWMAVDEASYIRACDAVTAKEKA